MAHGLALNHQREGLLIVTNTMGHGVGALLCGGFTIALDQRFSLIIIQRTDVPLDTGVHLGANPRLL